MYKMIKELELTNEDNFIKCFDHLYQNINSDYDFGSTMKKIFVKEEAKRIDYSFLCCLLPCSFNDTDFVKDFDNNEHNVIAPKDIDTLEKISKIRNDQRKEESDEESDEEKLVISSEDINLDDLDIHNLNEPNINLDHDALDIEILE